MTVKGTCHPDFARYGKPLGLVLRCSVRLVTKLLLLLPLLQRSILLLLLLVVLLRAMLLLVEGPGIGGKGRFGLLLWYERACARGR